MKRSIVSTAAAAAALALTLAACGDGSDGPADAGTATFDPDQAVTLTFTWWGNDDRADRYNQAIDLFNEQYPNITVQGQFQDFSNYWTSRATEAAGRALPDVMQFDSAYLREYAGNSHLLDLAPYVEDGSIDLSGYDESIVAAGELDGAQVAIPTSTNTLAMFVNPGVLAQVGVEFPGDGYTYDDLNAFIQEVSDADVQTEDGYKIYGSGDYVATFWFFLQWLLQEGTEPFTQDGALNFDQDDVVEWLELTADLRDADAVYPIARGLSLAPLGGFTVNEAASEASWDNFLAGYSADSGTDDLEILPIPSGPDGTANFFRPSMHLAVGANTEHPEVAALLVDFLLTDPQVGQIFGTSRGVPADAGQRDAVDAEEGSIDAAVIAYEEQVAQTDTVPAPIPVKGFGTIEAKWKALGEELSYKTLTPEQFAEQWFAEAEMAVS